MVCFRKEPVYQCTFGLQVLVGITYLLQWCGPIPKRLEGCPVTKPLMLTVVVDTVDQTDTHLSVVVGHKDDVEDVLTIGVQLPQPSVHSLQSLDGRGDPPAQTPRD